MKLSTMTVSVIVPHKDGLDYLKRCLPAILSQTHQPDEVIVIDDGSSPANDPTALISSFGTEYGSRVRVIRFDNNRGLPSARNAGIRAATGQFIATHDCDDVWRPTKLERTLELFAADPTLDAVFTDFVHRHPTGELAQWQGGLMQELQELEIPFERLPNGCRFTESLEEPLIKKTSFIHPSTLVVRREQYERAGLFDESYRTCEDLEMWFRLSRVCRFGLVNEILVDVEQRPQSLGHQTRKVSEMLLRMYRSLFEAPRFESYQPSTQTSIMDRILREHVNIAWDCMQHGEQRSAREHLRYAYGLEPSWNRRLAILKCYIPRAAKKRA
jgi:glycosyltransferase involved in cell wall biosynthesis